MLKIRLPSYGSNRGAVIVEPNLEEKNCVFATVGNFETLKPFYKLYRGEFNKYIFDDNIKIIRRIK